MAMFTISHFSYGYFVWELASYAIAIIVLSCEFKIINFYYYITEHQNDYWCRKSLKSWGGNCIDLYGLWGGYKIWDTIALLLGHGSYKIIRNTWIEASYRQCTLQC